MRYKQIKVVEDKKELAIEKANKFMKETSHQIDDVYSIPLDDDIIAVHITYIVNNVRQK